MPSHGGYPSALQSTPQWGFPSAPQGGVPPPSTYPQSSPYPSTAAPMQVNNVSVCMHRLKIIRLTMQFVIIIIVTQVLHTTHTHVINL